MELDNLGDGMAVLPKMRALLQRRSIYARGIYSSSSMCPPYAALVEVAESEPFVPAYGFQWGERSPSCVYSPRVPLTALCVISCDLLTRFFDAINKSDIRTFPLASEQNRLRLLNGTDAGPGANGGPAQR